MAAASPAGGTVAFCNPPARVPPHMTEPPVQVACSIARTLEVIGDRWTLLILSDAFCGVRRFDDLQRDLGIARNILTDRPQKLVDRGVLSKTPYQARPVRYEYRLTPK